jgi:transposase-like protein
MIEVLDTAAAGRALARRLLRCPGCAAPLRPWGRARSRTVRGRGGEQFTSQPDRARCTGCRATHVVLDAGLLAHRAYSAGVVGQALLAAAAGLGHRPIAAQLAVPAGTVRGWLRRARGSARGPQEIGVRTTVLLDPDVLPVIERTDPLTLALDALGAAALAFGRRFAREDADPWARINVLTRGRLLVPFPTG